MQRASDQLDFEKAAQYRDWYQQLERMLEKQERVAAPVLQHNAALIHPHEERVDVLFVRFGQFVESVHIERPVSEAAVEALTDPVARIFDPDDGRPSELSRRQVDEIRLLSHWMYAKRRSLRKVSWETNVSPEAFVRAIGREIASAEPASA
jgi:DNA polymerase-3 subunit epsilon